MVGYPAIGYTGSRLISYSPTGPGALRRKRGGKLVGDNRLLGGLLPSVARAHRPAFLCGPDGPARIHVDAPTLVRNSSPY